MQKIILVYQSFLKIILTDAKLYAVIDLLGKPCQEKESLQICCRYNSFALINLDSVLAEV